MRSILAEHLPVSKQVASAQVQILSLPLICNTSFLVSAECVSGCRGAPFSDRQRPGQEASAHLDGHAADRCAGLQGNEGGNDQGM